MNCKSELVRTLLFTVTTGYSKRCSARNCPVLVVVAYGNSGGELVCPEARSKEASQISAGVAPNTQQFW